jgi:hypothetical protein
MKNNLQGDENRCEAGDSFLRSTLVLSKKRFVTICFPLRLTRQRKRTKV